jgi:flagellar hook-associated protein 2
MAIRMSGLVSGLDTESIIQELMSVQSMKLTKKENSKTKTEWKLDKWKELNTKIYSLYTGKLSKIKLQGNYTTKKVTSADESAVSATASGSAANGSHTLEVKSLASAQYVTGAQITSENLKTTASSKKIDSDSLLTNFSGIEEGLTITVKNKASSQTKTLEVTGSTKISDLVSICQDAGLTASFDEKQGRFFISSKDSGESQGFTITCNEESEKVSLATDSLKKSVHQLVDYDNLSDDQKDQIDDYFEIIDMTDLYTKKESAKKEYEDYQKKYDALSEEEKTEAKKNQLDTYLEAKNTAEQAYEAGKEERNADLENMLSYVTGIAQSAGKFTADEITTKIAEMKEKYNTSLDADAGDEADAGVISTSPLTSLGLGEITGEDVNGGTTGVTVRAANDAVIILDGAQMSDTSNTMTVNGLTFDLKAVTDGEIKMTVATDVDEIYNNIKDFFKEYNEVLKAMNEAYNADSARKYDVLTSAQKESMSDEEVETWEGKIKDSLLRRDTTLASLISVMKSTMQTSVKLDSLTFEVIDTTKKDSDGNYRQYNAPASYSLSSFGIVSSSDYSEGGLLHIYGDEDDETYSSEENKLKKALEENPTAVQSVLSKLCTNLYDTLTNKMSASSISSAMTFYNDKEIKNQISTYEDELSTLQDKLNDQEDRYYSQFTAMEKAMSNMQTQSSSLSGLLGTSS